MIALSAYGLLLISAFLSASLLPGSSEAVLIGLLASAKGSPVLLIAVASVGNIAGSVLNWAMGRFLERFKGRSWFPLNELSINRAQAWFARFGVWSLLFAWVPVIGDPLTLVAGVLRVPLWRFLPLVMIGKVLRYTFIVLVWRWWETA